MLGPKPHQGLLGLVMRRGFSENVNPSKSNGIRKKVEYETQAVRRFELVHRIRPAE